MTEQTATTIQTFCVYSAVAMVLIGGLLGLIGVWWPKFWDSEISRKLGMTDMILFFTAVGVVLLLFLAKWVGLVT